MKLFDVVVEHLPKEAGLASIRWTIGLAPQRSGASIVLPLTGDCEFTPLRGGTQFVYRYQQNGRQIFFGGTDERPFLVELDQREGAEAIKALAEEGESAFYRCLRPPIIETMENRFGAAAKRQGDIFAMPVPWAWEDIENFVEALGATFETPEEWQVFGTRHALKGRIIVTTTLRSRGLGERVLKQNAAFATGVIEAPDHLPLHLGDQIHLLAQVEILAKPQEAD